MENVLVAGAGVLGSQIAFQSAFKGKNVTILEMDDEAAEKAKGRIEKLKDTYLKEFDLIEKQLKKDERDFPRGLVENPEDLEVDDLDQLRENVKSAYDSITFETDKEKASQDIDFVIEAIIEDKEIKQDFHQSLSEYLPEKTIVASNSSTLLPSMFAEASGRPEKYLHFHFANTIWRNNIGEIMGHEDTDEKSIEAVNQYAEEIGMIPVNIHKERPGYLLNSLLIPWLNAAIELYVEDYAEFEDIDKTWKISTGSPRGPFEVFDVVGMNVAYQIMKAKPEANEEGTTDYKAAKLFKDMIDQGKLGRETGQGFYTYDD